jgi:hypothetical protein
MASPLPPLNRFLEDLRNGKLPSTDPEAIAKHYGINPDHVRGYMRLGR